MITGRLFPLRLKGPVKQVRRVCVTHEGKKGHRRKPIAGVDRSLGPKETQRPPEQGKVQPALIAHREEPRTALRAKNQKQLFDGCCTFRFWNCTGS